MASMNYHVYGDVATQINCILQNGENTIINLSEKKDPVMDFALSVTRTLSDSPKWLECRFLYDARGSELFDEICTLSEYYPTRTEAAILKRHACEISKLTGPVPLVELGSGYSVKTHHIFSAYLDKCESAHYVPVDVSREALEHACASIGHRHPEVRVAGINATYECAFPFLEELSPVMVIFLGSTLGNFNEEEGTVFWTGISQCLQPGDFFLLGVDLVKDIGVLEAAYNDRAGVTAAFTRNLFARMNRELDSGVDLNKIEHVARFSTKRSRIEIDALFHADQGIHIGPTKKTVGVRAGERVRVEISRKFRLAELIPRLESFGLAPVKVFTDERDWFALLLLQRGCEE